MVAVAENHVGNIPLPPIVEPEVVIVLTALESPPAVEGLVHDDHTDLVADLQQVEGGGIVGDADGVEARFLEPRELTAAGGGVVGRAQHAVIVVDTAAAELDRLAVDLQAVVHICGNGTHAEAGLVSVHLGAVLKDHGAEVVEVGVLGVP